MNRENVIGGSTYITNRNIFFFAKKFTFNPLFAMDRPKDRISTPGSIGLRQATVADVPLLRFWDEQPHVIASDPNDNWNWEVQLLRQPLWRWQFVAELDGRPIGFVQIIDPAEEETHYWGTIAANLRAIDIWIGSEGDLGKGYGTQIMQLAVDFCFRDPRVDEILVDPLASNSKAHRFYERLGFRAIEQRQFGEDLTIVYQLDRAYWTGKFSRDRPPNPT